MHSGKKQLWVKKKEEKIKPKNLYRKNLWVKRMFGPKNRFVFQKRIKCRKKVFRKLFGQKITFGQKIFWTKYFVSENRLDPK